MRHKAKKINYKNQGDYTMNPFDSLGARQLPPDEPDPISFDWRGNPLYQGDLVYSIDDQFIHEDDLLEYCKSKLGKPMPL